MAKKDDGKTVLTDITRFESVQLLIDEYLGGDFGKEVMAWEDDAPDEWVAMAKAYAQLAFVRGYRLRKTEERLPETISFEKKCHDLGHAF